MLPISIMLGRLSPPVAGRLQAFPWDSWAGEFEHARTLGFDGLEWLFDADRYQENPIWTAAGISALRARSRGTDTTLRSLCADYFLAHPFVRVSREDRDHAITVLERLIRCASSAGIETILLPVLESAEVRTPDEKDQLLDALHGPLQLADEFGVRLGLETELPAHEFLDLIEVAGHPSLGAYYDTGNATAKGFDIAADVRILGPRLVGVHIKDRKVDGGSVRLGAGDADFRSFMTALGETTFTGPLVLQTPSGRDYLGAAGFQLAFISQVVRASYVASPVAVR